MSPDVILQKMRALRQSSVDLGNGRAMIIMRPTDLQVSRDILRPVLHEGTTRFDIVFDTDKLHQHVVDWRGMTENDLLQNGSADAVPFAPQLAQELLACNSDWLGKVLTALQTAVVEQIEARAEAEKN